MRAVEIGVVGGTRGMGRWFAALFRSSGHLVHVWGRGSCEDMEALIPQCHVVVVSVPLGATEAVIRRVGPIVAPGAALMDLSSLKAGPMAEMLSSSSSEVVGLHPLFGPRARNLKGKNVVLCRGRGDTWSSWIRGLLASQGARVLEMDPEEHDRAMAVVQVLTHLNTMTMGLVMRHLGTNPEELLGVSTPIFQKKVGMIRKVFRENPGLYAGIVTANPHSSEVLESYREALATLDQLVRNRDAEGLLRLLSGGQEERA